MKTPFYRYFIPATLLVAGLMHSCKPDDPLVPDTDPRGTLISATEIRYWTASQIDSMITAYNSLAGQFVHAGHDIRVYKLIYETIDPQGAPITASGALCVPATPGVNLPLASYQHGTILAKRDAPSAGTDELLIGALLASQDYAVAMPDYLGLGEGPGMHYYVHARSEATAVIDMMRASRHFCANRSYPLNGQVFLFGYSQGGHATMAAHREIHRKHADEFDITASAPMAGPYDIGGAQQDFILSDNPYPTPGYLPYVIWSYFYAYRLPGSPEGFLRPPYDSIVPPYFDGTRGMGSLNNAVPAVPKMCLDSAVLADFTNNPKNPLRKLMEDNNLYNWVPKDPIRMYHCGADDQVSFENTVIAYNAFVANGSNTVSMVNVNNTLNHGDCAFPTLLMAKNWFDSLKTN